MRKILALLLLSRPGCRRRFGARGTATGTGLWRDGVDIFGYQRARVSRKKTYRHSPRSLVCLSRSHGACALEARLPR